MKPFHNKIYKNNEICVMSAWATTDWSFCFLLFLWFFALIEKLPGAENIVSFIQKKMPNIPCFQRNKCEDLSLWSGLICRKKLSNTINNDFTHLSVKKLATFQQPLLSHRLLLIPMASLLSISLFSFQYHYSHYSESSHLMLCFATQLFCIGLYQEKKKWHQCAPCGPRSGVSEQNVAGGGLWVLPEHWWDAGTWHRPRGNTHTAPAAAAPASPWESRAEESPEWEGLHLVFHRLQWKHLLFNGLTTPQRDRSNYTTRMDKLQMWRSVWWVCERTYCGIMSK